jgi:Tat protein secretion system quality control protein TatD with DNase activity
MLIIRTAVFMDENMMFENCFAIGECGLDSWFLLIRKFRKKFFKTDKI